MRVWSRLNGLTSGGLRVSCHMEAPSVRYFYLALRYLGLGQRKFRFDWD
jgi:hypothetical protein